jgi:formate dehydrogenase accessory protein FdhD
VEERVNATRIVPIIRVYRDGRREERSDELVEETGVVFRRENVEPGTDDQINDYQDVATSHDDRGEIAVPASPFEPERLAAGVVFHRYRLLPWHGRVSVNDGNIMVTVADAAGPDVCFREPAGTLDRDTAPGAMWFQPSVEALFRAAETLETVSDLRQRTGGVHTVLYVSGGHGQIVAEDVSRHSAIDRLVGSFLLTLGGRRVPGFVFLSCRITVDIVERLAAVNITTIASVSAPTAGAVDIARERGIGLYGFIRNGRMNVYGRVTTRRSTDGTGTHGPGERESLQSP